MEAADPFHLREILWSDGEDFFYLQLPTRRPRDEDDEARSALSRGAKLVPRSLYQTIPPPELLRAPEPLPEDTYIKVGTIFYFHPEDPEKSAIWQYMIQEAHVCETLMKYPHQNVAQYYGYVEKDGMMVGLCFKRYGQTLSDAMRIGLIRREDIEHSLDQIKKGIEHIHGLGLVHNDINPRNILLDADGKLVIIDFDSCRKQGESMLDGKCGTFPFSNDSETAEFQNDFYGLEKIREWMEENIP
ncbi:kinase-like domain-containing protein [Armillaria borealis]|uniref:Kinase-like domain-containing protein n=1 Tax=Armillaria borealis TaxID=47425 RepID=A0AA39IBX7_9AGAR|nr:kinase-like domain-containing protein [Armillaria borealis]